MDMSNLFGKVKEMQEKLKEAQDKLEQVLAEGESGGGMVKVTANGKKKLVKIEIEESLLTKDDKDVLQDLIVAAVNKAVDAAEVKAAEELKNATGGFMPNIPGMDFSNLFK